MPIQESPAFRRRLIKPPLEDMPPQRAEQIRRGLLDVCLNIDVHPNEPFSRLLVGTPNVTVYPANKLAIELGRKRYADLNLSNAFPGGEVFYEYEYRRALDIIDYYRDNNFDLVLDFHNCGTYLNGANAQMRPRTDGGFLHEHLLVAAGMMGLFNIVLINNYGFLNYVDNSFAIEVPRPTGTTNEQKTAYQQILHDWRRRIGIVAQTRADQLSFDHVRGFDLTDFTFYVREREIPRAQAKALDLEDFFVENAFERLPSEVAHRLGYTIPIFAEYWNYNCDAEEVSGTNGERKFFGSILTLSRANKFIKRRQEDLVIGRFI